MIQKEIKYNLHYDDVRGDLLRPPHDATSATVKLNKSQKDCRWKPSLQFPNYKWHYIVHKLGITKLKVHAVVKLPNANILKIF